MEPTSALSIPGAILAVGKIARVAYNYLRRKVGIRYFLINDDLFSPVIVIENRTERGLQVTGASIWDRDGERQLGFFPDISPVHPLHVPPGEKSAPFGARWADIGEGGHVPLSQTAPNPLAAPPKPGAIMVSRARVTTNMGTYEEFLSGAVPRGLSTDEDIQRFLKQFPEFGE